MSLAEIIDLGADHPWANLRINSVKFGADSHQAALSYYAEGSFTITFEGAIGGTDVTVNYERIGKLVHLTFQRIAGNNLMNEQIFNNPATLVPDFLRPNDFDQEFLYPALNINTRQDIPGLFVVKVDGSIEMFLTLRLADFTGGGICGSNAPICVTYRLS